MSQLRDDHWVGLVEAPVIALRLACVMLASLLYEAKLYIQPPPQGEIVRLTFRHGEGTGLAPLIPKETLKKTSKFGKIRDLKRRDTR
ncbi:hypothetical protein BGP83_07345 [Pseudomonas putida]|nr:hypothetical protein BGP83_07345 [Pseudomonas putida]